MEILIGLLLLVIAVGAYFYYKNKLDTNKDGHVSKEEIAPVVEQVKQEVADKVKDTLDVNKDGKVDAKDAVAVVKKTRAKKPAAPKTEKPAAAKKETKPRKPKMTVAK